MHIILHQSFKLAENVHVYAQHRSILKVSVCEDVASLKYHTTIRDFLVVVWMSDIAGRFLFVFLH